MGIVMLPIHCIVCFLVFLFFVFFFWFWPHCMAWKNLSFPTRDWTCSPCTGITESYPLNHHRGIPTVLSRGVQQVMQVRDQAHCSKFINSIALKDKWALLLLVKSLWLFSHSGVSDSLWRAWYMPFFTVSYGQLDKCFPTFFKWEISSFPSGILIPSDLHLNKEPPWPITQTGHSDGKNQSNTKLSGPG